MRACDETGGVPCPWREDFDGNIVPCNFSRCFYNLHDGVAVADAKVVACAGIFFERKDVRGGEVDDVDEVADAGAVGCGVLVAIDGDFFGLAERNFEDIGDEVGFDAVVFAKFFGGAGGVKVSQGNVVDAVNFFVPLEDLFKDEFGVAVGIDRFLRQTFVHRNFFRNSIGGAGGGEDDFFAAGVDHAVEEIDAADDVDLVVEGGVFHGFGDERFACEVDNGVGLGLF